MLRVVKLRIVVSKEKECNCLRENINKNFERRKHSSLTLSERVEASIIYEINKELDIQDQ